MFQTFLGPLLLRRTKTTQQITDALNLPSRNVEVVKIDFDEVLPHFELRLLAPPLDYHKLTVFVIAEGKTNLSVAFRV